MAAEWSKAGGITRRVGLYLRHDELGADMLSLAGSDPLTVTWARQHHQRQRIGPSPRPSARCSRPPTTTEPSHPVQQPPPSGQGDVGVEHRRSAPSGTGPATARPVDDDGARRAKGVPGDDRRTVPVGRESGAPATTARSGRSRRWRPGSRRESVEARFTRGGGGRCCVGPARACPRRRPGPWPRPSRAAPRCPRRRRPARRSGPGSGRSSSTTASAVSALSGPYCV